MISTAKRWWALAAVALLAINLRTAVSSISPVVSYIQQNISLPILDDEFQLIGNSLGGRMVDRHPLIASMVFCVFMIGGMVALVPSIHSTLGLAAALGLWGVTQAALFLVSHVRLMKAAPEAPAFAAIGLD